MDPNFQAFQCFPRLETRDLLTINGMSTLTLFVSTINDGNNGTIKSHEFQFIYQMEKSSSALINAVN